MKIIYILKNLISLSIIFTSCKMFDNYSIENRLVDQVLNKSAKIIMYKYDLIPIGFGAAMPGGPIRKLNLDFKTKDRFTKEELRRLLIELADVLINQVNTDKDIQPYLVNPPFTIENVQIAIYNSDKYGRELLDPEISTAEISQGYLTYRTVDPINGMRFKNEFKETYEEAQVRNLITIFSTPITTELAKMTPTST